ncbi:MAG TPA: bpX6 domain-containing protein, partial [Blastocatellia bacterium]|nr:bpX6 domain-containing protein [Blastocatellia bacterium]
MPTRLPRKLVHRGVVEAAAFFIDQELTGSTEAARRIIALWTRGVRVYRVADGFLISLASPARVDCDQSPGAPCISVRGFLSGAPLAKDELDALEAPSGALIIMKGGREIVEPLTDTRLESPEQWLAVECFEVVGLLPLGGTASGPRLAAEAVPFDARAKLEGVPAEARELREIMEALRTRASRAGKPAQQVSGGRVRAFFARVLREVGGYYADLLGLRASEGAASPPVRSSSPGAVSGRRAEKQGIFFKLRMLATRLLLTSGLGNLLGRQQARYLGRLIEMFERGDLNEALKHAIPLGGSGSESALLALLAPRPRATLSISPAQTRATSSISVGDQLMDYLRRLYRGSFERLEAQGKIEEAAFVLAELLQANEEAVSFLERHGRLRLAAEMAEARRLPPGLVVRQWFVAGDVERAVAIARRTGAFADAVQRLAQNKPDLAKKVRLLWAGSLADAGDYASAADIVWMFPDSRHLALGWLDRSIELGGPAGARSLAKKLEAVPAEFERLRDHAVTLLEDESLDGWASRTALAEALPMRAGAPEVRAVARAAVRALVRDSAAFEGSVRQGLVKQLIEVTGDGALRADLPAVPNRMGLSLAERTEPINITIDLADAGTLAVSDAAFLHNGRALVALGESGAKLLTRDGRTVAHFDVPAHKLVVSDNGSRAIALAPRGEQWRLSRLDLLTGSSVEWCDARIEAFAADYDGSMWFIAAGGDFYAIDVGGRRFDALWRVPEVGGSVLAVARSRSVCRFLTSGPSGQEQWVYELPSLALRSRGRFPGVETQTFSNSSGSIEDEVWFEPAHVSLSKDGLVADASLPDHYGDLESGFFIRVSSAQSVVLH